jgi:hypothetical protein
LAAGIRPIDPTTFAEATDVKSAQAVEISRPADGQDDPGIGGFFVSWLILHVSRRKDPRPKSVFV